VAADNRDLNYDQFISEGLERVSVTEDYNSHNTRRLNVEEMADLLRQLPFVKQALAE
jgi:UDP-glucose 4-epimerase